MKMYVKPYLGCIEMRAEERLAVCDAEGSCSYVPDGIFFKPANKQPDYMTLS